MEGNFMNKIKEASLKMASLSIYKGILNRTVPKAFYELLRSADGPAEPFLRAWGEFFRVLCERGFSENLAECLTQTALFDENAFSLAAAAGKTELSPALMAAVRRDLQTILELSSITPEEMLDGSPFAQELAGLGLPCWKNGEPTEQMRGNIEECVSRMAEYYRGHGCGMYARYRAFIWRGGKIEPVEHPDSTKLDDLKGYDVQRKLAIDNTLAFLQGLPANNCLLYGDRGTGKSSTVKALLNEFYPKGLRVIEMPKESLMDFPTLVDQIAPLPMKFVIFIDDLSFSRQDDTYAALKAVLEGGLAARPENTLIYATSNRRHLVRESFKDKADRDEELHTSDTVQEKLSLVARFGVTIYFGKPEKKEFQKIVTTLAARNHVQMDEDELLLQANQWELTHGGFSGRAAQQFIDYLLGQQ